jgi:hypothetical protein
VPPPCLLVSKKRRATSPLLPASGHTEDEGLRRLPPHSRGEAPWRAAYGRSRFALHCSRVLTVPLPAAALRLAPSSVGICAAISAGSIRVLQVVR